MNVNRLPDDLDALRDALAASKVGETETWSTIADIETANAPLTKPEPNHGIVNGAWEAVQKVATLAGWARTRPRSRLVSPACL